MISLSLALMMIPTYARDSGIEIWQVDPLTKVFRDATASNETLEPIDVARGEQAEWQVVIQSPRPLTQVSAVASSLKGSNATIKGVRVRVVGYVPVNEATPKPSADQLRKPPADFPDPLLEANTFDLNANEAQPLWIDVKIPAKAKGGIYTSEVKVMAKVDGRDISVMIPLKAQVYEVDATKSRLWVTNWYFPSDKFMQLPTKPGETQEEVQIRAIAKSLAAHRQNVALISPVNLTKYSADASGKLLFDFSRFDMWVKTFIDAGVIGRIEGGHIGGRIGDWESAFGATVHTIENGKDVSKNVDPASPEADKFYSQFFPALMAHLKEKKWLDKYIQHLADEPIKSNEKSYRALADLVHKYLPGVKTIEACHSKDLVGAVDIWVPQLNYFADSYDHYQARQKAGDEVWMYTCVYPQGEYANRFIEQPLIRTRLLHWINFRYNATGYLHWGFNYWFQTDDPYKTLIAPTWFLPAGDPWIVYPGKNGIIDSIRYEALRDGVADHELLSQLAAKDKALAQKLAERHILAFDKYDTDVATFRKTRKEVLQALSKK
jgi:hypothetical protein